MGKLNFGKVLDCLSISTSCTSPCFCMNYTDDEIFQDDEFEKKPLIAALSQQIPRLKDVIVSNQNQTLAFQLKPKTVVLRVSMHCNGCAKKVQKHVSKLDGVTSYKVDLESKMVVVIGDIIPLEVLQSVSKVKNAAFWDPQSR